MTIYIFDWQFLNLALKPSYKYFIFNSTNKFLIAYASYDDNLFTLIHFFMTETKLNAL